MAPPVLEFRKIVKRFDTVTAIDAVSFSVQRGEIFTLLGPSGCGKTTTLRLVAGLEEPEDGEISIDGATVAAPRQGIFLPPEKRRLGMVFQSYAIWPHLTVFENVAFPLRVRHENSGVIRQRVGQALETVGLAGLSDRGATQLSGGQQQRVAIARAFITDPVLLVADEPTGDLDRASADDILAMLSRLNSEMGKTIIMVTHDPHAARSAHLIRHLDKGELDVTLEH